jgi:xylulose-5-phosphate/fructose-6-phosphate phosphoketolase
MSPIIVDVTDLKRNDYHQKMMKALEKSYQMIRAIQKKARSSKTPLLKPKWPMIAFRSVKGWGGIKELHNHKVEGTYRSHGIPAGQPEDAIQRSSSEYGTGS